MTNHSNDLDDIECHQAEERLHAYLDRELSEYEEALVRRHLDACENCRARFRFSDRIRRLIAQVAQDETCPDGLRNRIQMRLQGQ